MDQDQNALSLTALAWDRNGELCSEALERLLERLQAQEFNFPEARGNRSEQAQHQFLGLRFKGALTILSTDLPVHESPLGIPGQKHHAGFQARAWGSAHLGL